MTNCTLSDKKHRSENKEKRRCWQKNAKHFSFSPFSLCETHTSKSAMCHTPHVILIQVSPPYIRAIRWLRH
jgi:hypothetical protein